jgi:hypothetical protein
MAAQANAICAQRNRELKATTPPGASLREILGATSRRATIEHKALSELIRLTPPPKLASDWRTIVLATAAALRRTVTLERYAGASDSASAIRQKALLNKPQLSLLAAAARAGIKQCSVVAGPAVRPF